MRQSIAPQKGREPPDQKQDYPSPVPAPLRVLRVFWDDRDQTRKLLDSRAATRRDMSHERAAPVLIPARFED